MGLSKLYLAGTSCFCEAITNRAFLVYIFTSLNLLPMKKAFLFTSIILALGATVYASGDKESTIVTRATALTRIQVQKARLDEGQYLKVKNLNIRMLTEMEDIRIRFASDPAILDERLAVAQARYELELTSIMRPAQLAMFNQARNNMTALSAPR